MPTLQELLEEHKRNKNDKRVFGLVLPGGGMRAVYSASAVFVMINNELSDAFDHVIGVSAGAICGAYLIAEDLDTTRRTYQDDLTNKNFINLMRREKKIDIDYMIDMVLKHKRPINKEKLMQSKTNLHVILTDASTGEKTVVSDHKEFLNIYEELRATAALPILYDKKVKLGNKYFIDGGVSDNLPIDVAINLGCTDIVVVLNQQLQAYHFDTRHDRLVRRLVKHLARKHTKKIRSILPTDRSVLQANIRRIKHPTKKIRMYVLEPSDEEYLVSIGSTDKDEIEKLGNLGVSDTLTFLNKNIKK